MREKLLELMKREGLKPSQLAEILEINPAGISHILAGRNKPGFDLLQKILRRFPRINPDWLLLDSDQIYRDEDRSKTSEIETSPSENRTSPGTPSMMNEGNGPINSNPTDRATCDFGLFGNPEAAAKVHGVISGSDQTVGSGDSTAGYPNPGSGYPNSSRKAGVRRIVIFYDDQTFESFSPTMR